MTTQRLNTGHVTELAGVLRRFTNDSRYQPTADRTARVTVSAVGNWHWGSWLLSMDLAVGLTFSLRIDLSSQPLDHKSISPRFWALRVNETSSFECHLNIVAGVNVLRPAICRKGKLFHLERFWMGHGVLENKRICSQYLRYKNDSIIVPLDKTFFKIPGMLLFIPRDVLDDIYDIK